MNRPGRWVEEGRAVALLVALHPASLSRSDPLLKASAPARPPPQQPGLNINLGIALDMHLNTLLSDTKALRTEHKDFLPKHANYY